MRGPLSLKILHTPNLTLPPLRRHREIFTIQECTPSEKKLGAMGYKGREGVAILRGQGVYCRKETLWRTSMEGKLRSERTAGRGRPPTE